MRCEHVELMRGARSDETLERGIHLRQGAGRETLGPGSLDPVDLDVGRNSSADSSDDLLYSENSIGQLSTRGADPGWRAFLSWAFLGVCVGIAALAFWPLSVFLALILALVSMGFVFVAILEKSDRDVEGNYRITRTRLFGPGLPADGLSVELVRSVRSNRASQQSGSFVLFLTDGSSIKIRVPLVADPDAYWAALKRIVNRSEGWEWGPTGKKYCSSPPSP